MKGNMTVGNILRALRLPFITASILPFILGSLIDKSRFQFVLFLVGLLCVITTHLGANLLNDYADSQSGVDWYDRRFFGFFGGSKLIQENILSEQFYLRGALICFLLALGCVVYLVVFLKSLFVMGMYLFILFLGFCYSHRPFRFIYNRLGEVIIFLLFGPALVMGGYFIQTGIFPSLQGFLLSLPFGFFTTAILLANEVPDFEEDIRARKFTWVSLTTPAKAYLLYYGLMSLGFLSIIANIYCGYLKVFSLVSLLFILLTLKAGDILKSNFGDKRKLIQSSQITIGIQTVVSVILIIGVFS